MTRLPSSASPLSRRFDVATVRDGVAAVTVEASADERDALARRCGLPGIDALAASFRIRRDGSDGFVVTGRVTARMRQVCVVTTDEFGADLDEAVDLRFAPEAEVDALAAARAARPGLSDDEALDDLPDPIVGGKIDLGELTAEIFALGLDPYPRKPGAAFAPPDPDAAGAGGPSPFAVLRDLADDGKTS